ncbi:MAG: hypothetical protein OXN96_19150 [Bryobacterales bacterium]|nr:hypothetical protein [Bryobacterales bacterium]
MSGYSGRPDLDRVCRALDGILNPGAAGAGRRPALGFAVLVFPFGTAGQSHYASNGASKAEMAALFREAARRLEERSAMERAGRGIQ